MLSERHSRTAELTAAIRASHYLYDQPQVFSDPFALALTSPMWRTICGNRFLHWIFVRKKLGHLRPVHGWILSRSKYAEEKLHEFIRNGGTQYVQIGAGFDSISLRQPTWLGATKVFELDHPATQALKAKRVARIASPGSVAVEYVAVDLESESICERLKNSSLDPSLPAFFSWLGVIYYLTSTAIENTLLSVHSAAAASSELVFDYLQPESDVPESKRATYTRTRAMTASLGEPYQSFHSRSTLKLLASRCGYQDSQILTDSEIENHLLCSRHDDLSVMPGCGIAHLTTI